MTRLPLTICLALAWFFAVNALLSMAVAGATAWWRVPARRAAAGGARIPGGAALGMRLLPSLAAAAAWLPQVLRAVHGFTESCLRLLP